MRYNLTVMTMMPLGAMLAAGLLLSGWPGAKPLDQQFLKPAPPKDVEDAL